MKSLDYFLRTFSRQQFGLRRQVRAGVERMTVEVSQLDFYTA
jgi:hypothetical protein